MITYTRPWLVGSSNVEFLYDWLYNNGNVADGGYDGTVYDARHLIFNNMNSLLKFKQYFDL